MAYLSLEIKKNMVETYIQMQKYLLLGLFGITTVGTIFYANEKYTQYGGDFSLKKFIIN